MIVALVSLIVFMAIAIAVTAVFLFRYAEKERIALRNEYREKHLFLENQCFEYTQKADVEKQNARKAIEDERQTILKHYIEAVGAMTSFGRYQLDAGVNALKMQGIIDTRVASRTQVVRVDAKTGKIVGIATEENHEIEDQPPDPNVRTMSILDEVHEAERDAQRILNPEIAWTKRDERIEP